MNMLEYNVSATEMHINILVILKYEQSIHHRFHAFVKMRFYAVFILIILFIGQNSLKKEQLI
jgi:hypothetical protein